MNLTTEQIQAILDGSQGPYKCVVYDLTPLEAEKKLQDSIKRLGWLPPDEATALRQERDELAATVGRAREFMTNNDMLSEYSIGDLEVILLATPQQNLNAVKQQAVDEYKHSITEPNAIVHRYPVVDLSGSYLPGANGRATMMFGHIENAESSSPKAFIKCVIGRLLELLDDFNSNDCSTVKMPHVDTKKSAIEVAFTDGYTAGNGYPPSQWEVDQYMQSVKDGE